MQHESYCPSRTPGGPTVRPGDPVLVTMPDGTTTLPGTVSVVGAVMTAPPAQAASSGQGQPATPVAVIPVAIRLAGYPGSLDQAPVQVTVTEREDKNVLAVPVTALLAQPGGGYAVRTSGAPHRLIPVTAGLYDDETSLVEVSGAGLAPGLRVQVGQG